MLKFKQFVDTVLESKFNRTSNKYKTQNVDWDDVAPGDYIADGPNIGEISVVISNTKRGFILKRVWNNIRKKDGEEFLVPHDHDAMKDHPKSIIRVENFVEESAQFVNEGGNAVESRPMTQKEAVGTLDYVMKKILPLIGLDKDSAKPIGSFNKKLDDQLSGDLDIACSMDRIAGVNSISIPDVLDFVEGVMKKNGITVVKSVGFNQVSIGVPIDGKATNGIAQVDLMMTSSLDWSTFMYHSPDFRAAESKYKGMYRNVLLMSIVSECKKEATKLTDTGETQEYKQFVIRLGQGIFEVTKTLMGAKGLVKTAKLLHDQDKFVTNTPEAVTEIAFGPNVHPSDIMTFENIWKQFTDKNFIHRDRFDAILQRFKIYIISSKVPVPTEVEEDFPNLF